MATTGYRAAIGNGGLLCGLWFLVNNPTTQHGELACQAPAGAAYPPTGGIAVEAEPHVLVSADLTARKSGVLDLTYMTAANIGGHNFFYRRSDDNCRTLKARVPITSASPLSGTGGRCHSHVTDDASGRIYLFYATGDFPAIKKTWLTVGKLDSDGADYGSWTTPILVAEPVAPPVLPWLHPDGRVDIYWQHWDGTNDFIYRADTIPEDGQATFNTLQTRANVGGFGMAVRKDGLMALARFRNIATFPADWRIQAAVAEPLADGAGWDVFSPFVNVASAPGVGVGGHGGVLPLGRMLVRDDGAFFLSVGQPLSGAADAVFMKGCRNAQPGNAGTWTANFIPP